MDSTKPSKQIVKSQAIIACDVVAVFDHQKTPARGLRGRFFFAPLVANAAASERIPKC